MHIAHIAAHLASPERALSRPELLTALTASRHARSRPATHDAALLLANLALAHPAGLAAVEGNAQAAILVN
eukprot:tig00020849_g14646.t1